MGLENPVGLPGGGWLCSAGSKKALPSVHPQDVPFGLIGARMCVSQDGH